MVLLYVKIICTRQVTATCKFECELRVVQGRQNVWHQSLFVHTNAEYLTLAIDAKNPVCRFMLSRHKDRLARDTVHVNACTGFEIIKVNEAVLRRKVDNSVLLGHLHGYGEVVRSFRWEVYIDGSLREWRVGSLMVDLHNM